MHNLDALRVEGERALAEARAMVAAKDEEVAQLRAQSEGRIAALAVADRMIKSHENKCEDLGREVARLKAAQAMSPPAAERFTSALKEAEEKLQAANAALSESAQREALLKDVYERAKTRMAEARAQEEQSVQARAALEAQVAALQRQLEEQTAASSGGADTAQLREEFAAAQRELAQSLQREAKLQEITERARVRLQDMRAQEEQLAAARAQVAHSTTRVGELEATLATAQRELGESAQREARVREAHERAKEALQQARDAHARDRSGAQSELASAVESLREAQQSRDASQQQAAERAARVAGECGPNLAFFCARPFD